MFELWDHPGGLSRTLPPFCDSKSTNNGAYGVLPALWPAPSSCSAPGRCPGAGQGWPLAVPGHWVSSARLSWAEFGLCHSSDKELFPAHASQPFYLTEFSVLAPQPSFAVAVRALGHFGREQEPFPCWCSMQQGAPCLPCTPVSAAACPGCCSCCKLSSSSAPSLASHLLGTSTPQPTSTQVSLAACWE